MDIGDSVKVWLPGETPWVEVIVISDQLMKGRIDNVLFHDYPRELQDEFMLDNCINGAVLPKLHDYKLNDELWFERRDDCWQPVVTH